MAAVTHARRRERYESVNRDGTARLVRAAVAAGAGRFVLVSSRVAVPGAGAYGETKLAAEGIVRSSGLGYVILRPAEVVGGGRSEGVDDIVARARRGAPIPVVGDGSDWICPVGITDVAAAIAAATVAGPALGNTYVLGGPGMTIREFAELCADRLGPVRGRRSRVVGVPSVAVALAARASAVLPLPIYPDQLARLRAPKPSATPAAAADLGFRPPRIADLIRAGRS